MKGLTDIHQHLLYGLDDGAQDAAAMHAMLRDAHAQGVGKIYATPHACPGYRPFDAGLYAERLAQAREYCKAQGFDIQILPGAEIAWTYQTAEAVRMRRLPSLGGTDHVLLELWDRVSWREVREAVQQMNSAGFKPVLAHVERYACFRWSPASAIRLREELDVAYQVNASTVLFGRGILTRRFLNAMLDAQAIDAVASDAHNSDARPQRLGEAAPVLLERCGRRYATRMLRFDRAMQ